MLDKELIEAIERANQGLEPPSSGELRISIFGSPASVQSSKSVKNKYLEQIKDALLRYKFLLTGQLVLEITWLVPAKSRYETDAKADIDNCIKPILDAFTGPAGLFIDDCQLKGLYICWRHIESGDERLDFYFNFDPIQWCNKNSLAFIRMDSSLCIFVDTAWPKAEKQLFIDLLKMRQQEKAELEQSNVSYLATVSLMGGSQPFHRSRTCKFPIYSPESFIEGGCADN
ncbi:RusA family crossover junction endodeoxyribonuclease [Stenotrophomonas sp.]|uniref:RusA family crossover junction endodeoxyribonuclease n=1 Tax=Stenotrophomonas sp. TaxID=69392 RepID=UPI0028A95348|nr:RusA family crossover junction endodeoxyribonuclease [Stenotrophomonas sp.]